MTRARACASSVIASIAALLLVALPMSGDCDDNATQSYESSEQIEEIVVRGYKSLISLKREMYDAEDAVHELYNSLNSDDDYDIRCYKEAPTGSKLKRRVCMTDKLSMLLSDQTQRMMRGEPYAFPAHEVKEMHKYMLAEMLELASIHPDYQEAIETYNEAKETWESEHERRCTGRFLVCRPE